MKPMLSYKARLLELIKQRKGDGDIARTIYEEYGIRLSQQVIKAKKSPENYQASLDSQKKYELNLTDRILKVLRNKTLKSREISEEIKKIYSIHISKREINQLIHKYLKDKIYYNRDFFTYELRSESNEIEFPEENKIPDLGIKESIQRFTKEDILSELKVFFRKGYSQVNTGNEKLDYLIKTIVKDNNITECEEAFLKQKAKELGVEENLIDHAKKALHSNNPYLDNLLHIIYADGLITNTELNFLKEKCTELNFTKTFVNKRFWVLGIIFYTNYLRSIEGFDRLISLVFLGLKINYPKLDNDMWVLSKLNIFNSRSIPVIIENGIYEIENELIVYLQKNFDNVLNKSEKEKSFKTQNSFKVSKSEIRNEFNSAIAEIMSSLHSNNGKSEKNDSSKIENKIGDSTINFDEENQSVTINNTKFYIKRKRTPYLPLFYFNFNSENGQNQIFLNTGHKKYCSSTETMVIEFACSVYYTKQTMTSRDTDIFIERFHNNLQLIE